MELNKNPITRHKWCSYTTWLKSDKSYNLYHSENGFLENNWITMKLFLSKGCLHEKTSEVINLYININLGVVDVVISERFPVSTSNAYFFDY